MPPMKKPFERRSHLRNPFQAERDLVKSQNELFRAARALGRAEASGTGVKRAMRGMLLAALNSGLARRQLARLAKLDAKFGIENDAAFNERVFKFFRARASEGTFSFGIVDLDYLKKINDSFGHEAGDKALKMFTEGIARIAKKLNGFAGRFGGDEIKVLVRAQPEKLKEELTILLREMNMQNFSFSAGIASGESVRAMQDTSGKKKRNLLEEQADVALYESKEIKRGRIGIFKKRLTQLQLFK